MHLCTFVPALLTETFHVSLTANKIISITMVSFISSILKTHQPNHHGLKLLYVEPPDDDDDDDDDCDDANDNDVNPVVLIFLSIAGLSNS